MEYEIEKLAEEIHGVYCEQYKKNHGTEYWTKSDYSRLCETTKDYDRAMARFILNKRTNNQLVPLDEDTLRKMAIKFVEIDDFNDTGFIKAICSKFGIPSPKVVSVEEIAKELHDPWDKGQLGYEDSCLKLAQAVHQLIYGEKKQ